MIEINWDKEIMCGNDGDAIALETTTIRLLERAFPNEEITVNVGESMGNSIPPEILDEVNTVLMFIYDYPEKWEK